MHIQPHIINSQTPHVWQLHAQQVQPQPSLIISRGGHPSEQPKRIGNEQVGFQTPPWLVVEPTHLKNMLVKFENLPQGSG